MAEQIHYYKTISGAAHFAETGVVKNEAKLGQYLRMLRYAKKEPVQMFLDYPQDFEEIKRLFKFPNGTTWQDVYLENV
ncbi:MAG: hypothetical protein IK114_14150 [Fibrobacter sp.]|nr:hypothetical protein [Fibrobacter sp.]